MSDMMAGSGFTPNGDKSSRWASEHPVWARLGAMFEQLAGFCGSHSAGYMSPLRLRDR